MIIRTVVGGSTPDKRLMAFPPIWAAPYRVRPLFMVNLQLPLVIGLAHVSVLNREVQACKADGYWLLNNRPETGLVF